MSAADARADEDSTSAPRGEITLAIALTLGLTLALAGGLTALWVVTLIRQLHGAAAQ